MRQKTQQEFMLVPKSRKTAIHYLVQATVDTPMYGPMQTKEVACGVALDIAGWTSRVTSQPHLITCKACFAVAHPPKPSIA